jgi:hypothetical protein
LNEEIKLKFPSLAKMISAQKSEVIFANLLTGDNFLLALF